MTLKLFVQSAVIGLVAAILVFGVFMLYVYPQAAAVFGVACGAAAIALSSYQLGRAQRTGDES